jgi:hypothetical protein
VGSLGHVLDNPLCFPVNRLCKRFATDRGCLSAVREKDGLWPLLDRVRAQLLTHAKYRHHTARQVTCLLQVVLRASGRVLKDERLRRTPAEEHGDAVEKLLLSVQISVLHG